MTAGYDKPLTAVVVKTTVVIETEPLQSNHGGSAVTPAGADHRPEPCRPSRETEDAPDTVSVEGSGAIGAVRRE